jgi:hypothetical protein
MMNYFTEMRRVPFLSTCVIVVAMLINGIALAQPRLSQQPQSPPPANSTQTSPSPRQPGAPPDSAGPKKHKVWTNEDLVALRTPADIYILEKEAREAAEAEAAEKAAAEKEAAAKAAANPANQTGSDVELPATQEETEKKIKETEADLQNDTATVAKLQGELPDTPADQQPDKQKKIDHLNADMEVLQRDLKALQEHLKTFAPKPEEQTSPTPAGPPQDE